MNSSNNAVTTFHQSGDGMVWQPVMMAPMKTDVRKSRYPSMQTTVINIFSAICIFLGVASIGVQVSNRQRF
jgi:trimethylamine:corrinoid methyltransferase-like protein